jgi:bla regulator protein blaR1
MRFPFPATDAFAAAIVNHLWQSTAVLLAAWLLALALRSNRAAVRYWLWMTASLKFLLPFSLLIAAGAIFHPAAEFSLQKPAVTAAMVQMVEPLSQSTSTALAPAAAISQSGRLPLLLLLLWAAGALAVVARWARAWLRIRRAVRTASPRTFVGNVPVRSTSTLLEPGVFGVLRPVLLLPEGIMGRLTESQLNAVVAHELCHVRRRDNLTYALHMAVEALFWFYPPVWWVGRRLIEERECACDEAVVQSGNQAEIYAESIVSVCKFCLESPLACAAGVSGSDLKQRIVRIMSGRMAHRLGASRKFLLGAAASVAIALPTAIGIFHASQTAILAQAQDAPPDIPKFDVASIKPSQSGEMRAFFRFVPDGVDLQGLSPQMMLTQAFNVEDDRIVGLPGWAKTDRFDIQAKVAPEDAPKLDKLGRAQRFAMLQQLLEDRFNLKFHHETREMPVYVLVVAKGSSKLKPSEFGSNGSGGRRMPQLMMSPGSLESHGTQMDMLAHALSAQLGRTVIDKTGLTGSYDFSLHFTPLNMPQRMGPGPGAGPGGSPGADAPPPPDTSGPDIFTAVQEQLGLKLESEKGPVDVIVIDHIDKPSEN